MPQPLDPLSFPLRGARLIEASAGTGKTYTIAALYLRLILDHGGKNSCGRPLTPPQILVVTFTNAAAEELRDRIRKRLARSAAFFRGSGDGDDYLEALRNEFPADTWNGHARVLNQAAQWMDEAAIYTIHGWSQRMLRQHAFDSGSLFDLTLDPNERELLEEAARDYWRAVFYPRPKNHLKTLMDLTRCTTPLALLEKVWKLLRLPLEPMDDPFTMIEQRLKAIEDARQIWASDFDAAVKLLRRARADRTLNGNRYREASLDKWLRQLTDWVADNGPLPDDRAREKLSNTGIITGLNGHRSPPDHPAYEAFDALNAQLEKLPINAALMNHAARDIARRFQQEKKRRSQIGFDDLLTRLNDALRTPGNERLAHVIREQFPVALIDEFQDTDPIQYDMFQTIYLDRPDVGLFMIGDPKQAIYAFRGADIHTYLNARRQTAERRYTLGKNYRSTRGVVQSVNQMFQSAAGHPSGPFLYKDQIPFDPVDVQGRTARFLVNDRPVQSMYFWQLPQTQPVSKTGEEGYVNRMAEVFASEIVGLLNLAEHDPPLAGFQEPGAPLTALRAADMAVLVRNGAEADAIRKSLHQRRVRSVYLSDKESIFHTDEAKQMLILLRACAEPRRQELLRAALATPILDLPLTRLDHINRDETAWEIEVERFVRYQKIWRSRGVLPMFRALLHDFGAPGRLLTEAFGERTLTNVLHLAELLQIQVRTLNGEANLVRWLAEQLQRPGGDSDEQIPRLESDEELIRVITIHKSKGLEYPLVFLPFICGFRQKTNRNSPVAKYHDEQNRLRIVQDPTPRDLEAADQERLAEDLRLLYVAVTRAQYCCWLGVGVMGKTTQKNGEVSDLHMSGLGYLLSAGEMIPPGMLSAKLAQMKDDCQDIVIEPLPDAQQDRYAPRGEASPLGPALAFDGRVPSDWQISSYSGIMSGAGGAASPRAEDEGGEPEPDAAHSAVEDQLREAEVQRPATPKTPGADRTIHRFPRGPEPGTFLHGLLEWAAEESFGAAARDQEMVRDHLKQTCRWRGWDAWVGMLAHWMGRLLKTPFVLPDDQGRVSLADLTAGACQSELEFLFAAHQVDARELDAAVTAHVLPGAARPRLHHISVNGMLKGFIDLAFCHQGRYYVMDYKSNHLGEDEGAYCADAMAKAMLEHRYDLQYVLYTLAMHRQLKARLDNYDYRKDMGGAVYLFLRGVNKYGQGVYVDKPPWPLIEQLDDYFAGRGSDHAA